MAFPTFVSESPPPFTKKWYSRPRVEVKNKKIDAVPERLDDGDNPRLKHHPARMTKRKTSLLTPKPQIKKSAPQAEETISYQMPAFKLNGNLVYFAAFKDHIGFFPTSSGVAAFKKELSKYATSKGTIRFPLGKPIPFDLVRKIVKFRVKENLDKTKNKRK